MKLESFNFQTSRPKLRLLVKVEIPDFNGFCLFPPETESTNFGLQASGGLGIYLQSVLRTVEKTIQNFAIALPADPRGPLHHGSDLTSHHSPACGPGRVIFFISFPSVNLSTKISVGV